MEGGAMELERWAAAMVKLAVAWAAVWVWEARGWHDIWRIQRCCL